MFMCIRKMHSKLRTKFKNNTIIIVNYVIIHQYETKLLVGTSITLFESLS